MPDIVGHPSDDQNLLREVDRARRVLSECGRTLVRATDEVLFLQDMCAIAAALGGYGMAWVGLARHDEARSIELVACAGDHDGYFQEVRMSWGDNEFGRGRAGRAVRSGLPQVARNPDAMPELGASRSQAFESGHQAAATLPLVFEGETFGVFGVFAAQPNAFGPLEMELLDGVARDIAFGIHTLRLRAAQQRAEADIRASELRFHATFDQAPAGIGHVDPDGRFILANRRMEEMLGYGPGELIGVKVRDLSHPEDIAVTDAVRAQLRAGEIQSFTRQKRFLRKDGSTVWVGLTASLVRVDDDSPLFDIAVFEDITERVRAEALQRLEHTITRYLAEADSESGALRAAIRAICEAERWDCGRYFRPDDEAGVLRFADAWGLRDEVVEQILLASRELTYRLGDGLAGSAWQTGKPVWASDITTDPRVSPTVNVARNNGMHGAFVFPVRSEGKTVGVLMFNCRDVREPEPRLLAAIDVIGSQIGQFLQRKRTEAELRRFRAALDTSADIITLIDPVAMRYLDVNTTACEMDGYTREQMLRMGPQDLVFQSREELERAYAHNIASGQTTRLLSRHRRGDGSVFPTEVLRRAVCLDGRWIIVAIVRDISERIEAEQNLRRSEARFRSLIELSSDNYWETDAEHRFVESVHGMRFGLHLITETQLGKTRWELPYVFPDAAGWAVLEASMNAHERFQEFEFARLGSDGQIHYRSISGEPIFGEDGAFVGYQGVARDITARKRDEARLVELNAGLEARVAGRTADLESANKELEAFSYSVAHDLRAPLRAINGFSTIVLKENEGKLDPVSVNYLQRVQAGGLRMGELVDDLLDLARISRQKLHRQDLNLAQIAGKVVAALTEAQPERKVEIEIGAHMRANCDPGLIEVVMANLIGNAWKFTSKVADARIEVGVELFHAQNVYFVRDNGAGFEMEYVKNLFAPFHRLHNRDDFEGTGIGLSLVKRIIDKHGGKVWAEGRKSKGASFYFTLG